MRRLVVQKRPCDLKPFEQPKAFDFDTLITEPTIVTDEADEPLIVFADAPSGHAEVLAALRRIDYVTTNRGQKIFPTGAEDPYAVSRLVGFMPRRPGRADFCRAVSMSSEFPQEHSAIASWAPQLSLLYRDTNPARYARQRETLEKVLPCWRMGDSVFTSGICNRDNALPYHFDTGNFNGVWSCMLAFSRDMEGGHLVVPSYRIAFSIDGAKVLMFDGQGLLHGVLPFVRRSKLAYRYTVVYYALKLMCHCGTPEQELERIRRVKTAREQTRRK